MGKLEGKVAFITGAARGQGRSHAVRLAEEGADVIAVDICEQIPTVPYPMATPEDLAQTVKEVEVLGRRIVALRADVRDRSDLQAAFDEGVDELGGVDIVLANAGIGTLSIGSANENPQAFTDVVDVNMTGVWNTVEVAKPTLIEQGRGGAIVLTSSTAGIKGCAGDTPGGIGYTAAKHGVVGLMRASATMLGKHSIRANAVAPTGANTPMVVNDMMKEWLASNETSSDLTNLLPVELIEASDVSNAIAWLVSDDARYITGVLLPVDAGFTTK